MARWMILLLLLLLAGTVSANTSRANCINCAELLEEAENLVGGEWLLIIDGEDMTFLYRAINAELDTVILCCGIQELMILLDEDSLLWGLTYHVPRLDEAIISYGFREQRNNEIVSYTEYQYWRGENAPLAPPVSDPLQGHLESMEFQSTALNESRGLTIYTPPDYDARLNYPVVYLADGSSVLWYAGRIEQLILDGHVAPMLLVGVHTSLYRAEEYLPSWRSPRFAQHEIFFTEEVRLWAEETLGASTETSQRAVYGNSNSGVFAAAMALRHPDIYGIAFPFSAGMNPFDSFPDAEIGSNLRLYFAAGTLENGFFDNTQRISETFAEAGAEVIFSGRVAGHDSYMWGEELYHAVNWAFNE
jgi:enterochelin esterase-like enzyme